jgi:hypothetical membrane protein
MQPFFGIVILVNTSVKAAKSSAVRWPLAGPIFWALSIQYFVAQVVVARAWSYPYSVAHNTISDLGNTVCSLYRGSVVCSPRHVWMNLSFVALGISMIAGSVLLGRILSKNAVSAAGFACMSLAGVGTVLVGLFPENTVSALHIIGAALTFLLGNVALLLFGFALEMPRSLRYCTVASGIIALAALALFVTHAYLGLGIGGMERITAYPQTLWLTVFGVYAFRKVRKT